MGTAQPQQTTQTAAEATPRASTPVQPTPSQHENDQFRIAQAAGSLPHVFSHAMDGSPVDPKSFDPTPVTTPTWP